MDIGLLVILAVVVLWAAAIAAAITGTLDTFQYPPEAWVEAGFQRTSWIWQAALVLFVPGALVYSGIYFLRVRPRLVAAERTFAQADPNYPQWVTRTRWYDRFSRARRSPYEWDKAARRWWMWIPSALLFEVLAVFYLHMAFSHPRYGGVWSGDALAVLWSLTGLLSAATGGFWYGEYMPLTGRRPQHGGPLVSPTKTGVAISTQTIRPKTR